MPCHGHCPTTLNNAIHKSIHRAAILNAPYPRLEMGSPLRAGFPLIMLSHPTPVAIKNLVCSLVASGNEGSFATCSKIYLANYAVYQQVADR